MNNIFDVLVYQGSPKLASKYAKQIIADSKGKASADIAPGTKVYELVRELARYLPEDKKKRFM